MAVAPPVCEDGMTTFERHCQVLLRAYPAAYREVRGEEIIGTLLEATPPGRSWPLSRDIRCLISGGLRARAEQPKQFTTAANLRVAVLAGVAAYLAFSASTYLSTHFRWGVIPVPGRLLATAVVLPLFPMTLTWLSRRRLVVLGSALPAAAATCYAGPWQGMSMGSTVVDLACLGVLVALAGHVKRPGLRWFWPLGLLAIAPLPLALTGRLFPLYLLVLVLALGVLSIAWMVIDARPAIAMAVFLLAIQLPVTIGFLAIGDWSLVSALFLLIVPGITAVAVWRLRRQSGRGAPA
jgi:hypothetical protein